MKTNLLFILAFGLLASDSVLSLPKIDGVSNIQSHYRWLQKDELPLPVKDNKPERNKTERAHDNKKDNNTHTELRTRTRSRSGRDH